MKDPYFLHNIESSTNPITTAKVFPQTDVSNAHQQLPVDSKIQRFLDFILLCSQNGLNEFAYLENTLHL